MTTISPAVLPAHEGRATSRLHVKPATLLAACGFGLVLVVSLSRNLFDPPGFDQAYYQYAMEEIMAGRVEHAVFWSCNAPGIYLPHFLATVLFGTSPIALRLFDACWQLLTFGALVWLGGRDGRRWTVGWLAAALYALVYYGSGYIHTAQREGFAVLPLLILAHVVITEPKMDTRRREWFIPLLCLLGGAMGVLAFSIKQTLGLCYGAIWLFTLAEAWRHRSAGPRAFARIGWLTAGFVLSAVGGMMLLVQLGLWSGYADALRLHAEVQPGYVQGPALIRTMMPAVVAATVFISAGAWLISRRLADRVSSPGSLWRQEWVLYAGVALAVFGLLWLNHRWSVSRGPFAGIAGLLLPAIGAALLHVWSGQSRTWRICLIMAIAAFVSVALQGHFFVYHMFPMLAFASYLAANELARPFSEPRLSIPPHKWGAEIAPAARKPLAGLPGACRGVMNSAPDLRGAVLSSHARRVWTGVCLAAVAHLVVSHWGHTMTFFSKSPYVLADVSLIEHYSQVTKHKTRYPKYGTTVRAAERVRALTCETEPIVCLFRYPRLYHLARRPPTHPLICVNEWTRYLFPEFLNAIREKCPKVAVARIPADVRGSNDLTAVQTAVYADLESFFGPAGSVIREMYEVTEIIDDVCILQLRRT